MSNCNEYCIFYCGFKAESQLKVDEHIRDFHHAYTARSLSHLVYDENCVWDSYSRDWRLQGYDEFPSDYERSDNVTYSMDEKVQDVDVGDEPYERKAKRPRLEEI